ncbi:MAG: hypothetical protein ACRDRN_16085 [Sciscionella sp.]
MLDNVESGKDMVQELTQSAATHVGRIASILTGAVREVTTEVGEWCTDLFEMREAAKRSQSDPGFHQD